MIQFGSEILVNKVIQNFTIKEAVLYYDWMLKVSFAIFSTNLVLNIIRFMLVLFKMYNSPNCCEQRKLDRNKRYFQGAVRYAQNQQNPLINNSGSANLYIKT